MSARGKAPKAVETSDVARPRVLALSAIGAAAGVGIALASARAPLGDERPLPRPHATIACATCHEAPAATATAAAAPVHASAACKTCHGSSHVSTRAAHRDLAAKGELTCATCHRQHAGAQGVTFAGATPAGAEIVRWGSGATAKVPLGPRTGTAEGAIPKGTTVPLVSLAVCAKCHEPTSARDPIAACVPASVRAGDADVREAASLCFDEHRALGSLASSPDPRAACASQHGATRFVAWDAAREVAQTTAWVTPHPSERPPWIPAGGALAGALVFGASASALARRKRGGSKSVTAPAVAPARKRLPVIDPSTCLGCYACVDACPFDVLAVERYVAVVARPEECCGVVTCEQVCPNGSLRVADGDPVLDRPRTDEHLESVDVPGLYVAGDLTGLPLIKNAINQGVRAVDRIAETLPRRRSSPLDIVVVGGGPAGLAAALRAKEKGLRAVVLEQATIAASIKSFPRDKIVHDPPLELPVEGELWLREATKDELVAQWTRIVRARSLEVREGHRVVDVARDGDGFVVTAERGEERVALRTSRVVLAVGRRGTPRRLDLDIERGTEDRVAYALADARSFAGKKVVVVGLGDSAMEAAIALARQPGTSVTITYRGAHFQRGKARNVAEIESLVAQRKLRVLFGTTPVAVTRSAVVLAPHEGRASSRQSVAADALLVLIGGLPSWDLLTRAGIRRPAQPEPKRRKADVGPELEPSRT